MTGELKLVEVVYDDQCPICRHYCERLQGKDGVQLKLIDARKGGELMNLITAKGLDIDDGMVVRTNDGFYYGSDAIHAISQHTDSDNSTGTMNRIIFRHRWLAAVIYPLMKEVRNLVLRVKGITKINNLKR